MKEMILNGRGMLFGIIGALIGAIPNIVLKSLIAFSDFGEICFNSFKIDIGWKLAITPCGIFTFAGFSLWGTFVPTIVGGALFGLVGMQIGYKKAERRGYNLGKENWRGSFWWSFVGGILFDLIFIFMVFFPGY
jgi:hypothetical protein